MNELMDPATREKVLHEHTISRNGFGVTTTVKVTEVATATRLLKVQAKDQESRQARAEWRKVTIFETVDSVLLGLMLPQKI